MKAIADEPAVSEAAASERAIGPRTSSAVVASVEGATAAVTFAGGLRVKATIGVVGASLRAGDRVLATIDDGGDAWILGVAPRATPLLDEALGEAPADDEVVRVRDKRGQLLFEYDPERDRAVLHVPDGDLELSVPQGKLEMRARDGVVLEAGTASVKTSTVEVTPGGISLVSAVLSTAVDRAEILARKIGVRASRVESKVDRAKHVVTVAELRAGRIVERAKDVYREVERLSQTRAGRLKLVAKTAAQLVGENTLVKARDRVKVKGERIHLA